MAVGQVTEAWLQCQIDPGMFSDELAVTYPPNASRYQKSVFVPKETVQGEPGHVGKVHVRLIDRDGQFMAVLPSPEQDIVSVQPEHFSYQ